MNTEQRADRVTHAHLSHPLDHARTRAQGVALCALVAVTVALWAAPARADDNDEPQAPTFALRPKGWGDCQSGGGGQTEARAVELIRNGGFEYGQSGWLVRERQTDRSGATPPTQRDVNPDLTSSAAYHSPQEMAETPPAQRQGLGLELRLPHGAPIERLASQSLDMPVELSGLTVSFRYRMEQAYPDGAPTRMRVTLQRVRSQDEIWSRDFSPDIAQTPEATPLEDGWLRFEANITNISELAAMSASSVTAESGPLVLRLIIIGQGILVQLDDVSVLASGTIEWPQAPGRIAYATERPGRSPGYAINCMSPNGQSSSELFLAVGALTGLRWQPRPRADATPKDSARPNKTAADSALAIVSSHDPAFSNWEGDLYLLNSQGPRRLTHPHTQGVLARAEDASAVGKVRGLIRNPDASFQTVQVHVQGARAPAMLTLRPEETAAFELTDVADLGDIEQFVVVRTRRAAFEVPWRVNVKARATVDLQEAIVISAADTAHSVGQPAWDPQGTSLLLTGDHSQLMRLRLDAPNAEPVKVGVVGRHPHPSPVDARLLFVAADPLQPQRQNVFLWDADAPQNPPFPIAQSEADDQTLSSPTWLPDGEGFIYSAMRCPEDTQQCSSSLHRYTFKDGVTKRLALFADEEINGLTVSPDGQYMAFIRVMVWSGFSPKQHRSLWVLSLERPTQRWRLVSDEQPFLPDWSKE
jgi:hypothetical protein